jgi:hypothetical protein
MNDHPLQEENTMTTTTTRKSRAPLFAATLAMLGTGFFTAPVHAQNAVDDDQQLLAQIQTDKRAVVLQALALDDAQLRAFTPVYDEYQADRKKIVEEGLRIIDAYAANYDSMTDDAAGKLLKDWMAQEESKQDLMKKYIKKFDKVLPTTKVLRFVQIENKLNTVLSLPAIRNIPLAK